MRSTRFMAVALAWLLLLSSCTLPDSEGTPSEELSPSVNASLAPTQRVEFALPCNDSGTLDPLATLNSDNLALASLVYEGLFALDESFAPQPMLCEAWSVNETATVWTFTLRSDAVFSDGTPLTAKHVADSLKTARSSERYRERLSQIIGVSTDDHSVTITLSAPNGALPALLDIPIVLPVEDGVAPLGTGAYYYDRATDGGGLVLRQNPYYFSEESLPLTTIPLRSVTSADDRIAAFDTGLITAVTAEPTSTNALGYSGSYETWTCATTNLLYLGFNHASEVCQNDALRQAVSCAIDRDSIAATLFSGYADPTPLPIHPSSALYDATLAEELSYSLSAAEQLLSDAGYRYSEDGRLLDRKTPVTLELLVSSENSFRVSTAYYLAAELEKLGITVHVQELPWESYLAALSAGEFDLYLGQIKMTADFDPAVLMNGSLNYGAFENEETDALLTAYQSASDAARADAASALHANLVSTLPFTALCFLRTAVYTQWGAVSGVQPTQQNPFYHFELWSID